MSRGRDAAAARWIETGGCRALRLGTGVSIVVATLVLIAGCGQYEADAGANRSTGEQEQLRHRLTYTQAER